MEQRVPSQRKASNHIRSLKSMERVNMSFDKSMIELMKERQSIRTYETEQLSEIHYEIIREYINNGDNLMSIFGRKSRMELVKVSNSVTDKGIKLGTYGFIKNPQAYLVGISENNTYSLVEFGYVFQKLVLYLTELGIGTCWMGGTFSRKSFEQEIEVGEGEFIPAVTPIGYPKGKQRMFDKALRYVVKADNKKSWEKLFYDGSFGKTLIKENAGDLETPIEMVRLGPSASNKQPWRLVLSENGKVCHFYIEHTPNYSSSFGYKMQLLDMGIAMCHFDLACNELDIEGEWKIEDPEIKLPNTQMEYLFSWER